MPYTTLAKNRMLDALARNNAPGAGITHLSLHTAAPDASGSNEVTGGTPAYARKAVAWNAPSGGAIDDSTNGAVFDVPAGVTVTHVGYWSSTDFMASDDVTPEAFAAQGTYTVTDADLDLNNP